MSIQNCKIINLNKISDGRGNLTSIESNRHIPFEIKRVYYLYDVPIEVERGAHAHKQLHQLIIAINGSFEIMLDDGSEKKKITLNSASEGLYVCPMIWRELKNFSSNAVCVVLASDVYDENDYYRNYPEFIKKVSQK